MGFSNRDFDVLNRMFFFVLPKIHDKKHVLNRQLKIQGNVEGG